MTITRNSDLCRFAKDWVEGRVPFDHGRKAFVPKITTVLGFDLFEFFVNDAVDLGCFPAQMPQLPESSHPGPVVAMISPELVRQGLRDERPERDPPFCSDRFWRDGKWRREFREFVVTASMLAPIFMA